MVDDNNGLSPEEIEFQDQISDETTPESMTRALRRRASMLSSAGTRERQRQLDMDKHRQTVDDIDNRYARAVSGNTIPGDDITADSLKRDQNIKRDRISKISDMQNEFSAGGYWENYRKERAAADLIKSTNTFVGGRSTSEQIHRASKSVNSLGAITRESGRKTSTQLEKEVLTEKSRLAEQQEEISAMAAAGLSSPADEEAYRQAGIHHQESINKLGVLTGAQARQGRNKTDLMGRQRSTESLVASVGKDLLKRGVASEIASGSVGSMYEESLNLESIQDKIMKAAEAFEKALETSSDAAEDLGKDLEGLNTEYDKQKEIIAQLGNGSKGASRAAQWSGTAADVLQAGAVGLKTLGVDQELRDVANRTGLMAISNRQFQDHQASLSGDMSAFRRMNTNQYVEAAAKANTLGTITGTSVGLSAAADSAAIVSNILAEGSDVTNLLGASKALGRTAGKTAILGGSAIAKGFDVGRNLSSNETRIQAYQAYMAQSDEEKRVQDISMQAYRDTMGGNTLTSRGAGSGRDALFGQMNDPASRMTLAKLGMGTDQMQAIYGQGIAEMGADFRGADAAGMVKRSAELQRSGIMSASDYMSNMDQLNTVGGNAGNMETIMKNAVANGMDSSRNIQQMVAGIAGLSSDSAMMGISTAAGATNVMGLALDTEALRSIPKKMRAAAAASQIGKMNNSMTDSSMNLFNVAESFALRKAAPGVSDAQIARMQKLNASELAEIQADPSAASKFGLGFLSNDSDLLKEVSGIITRTESNKAGGLILSEKARAAMNVQQSETLSQKEFEARFPEESQEIIAAKGLHGVNAAITDPFLAKLAAGEKGLVKPISSGEGKSDAAEGVLAKQFQAMETLNTRGQEVFKKLYGGISEFNAQLDIQLKNFKPEAYEEQAGEAGVGKLSVKGFGKNVSDFGIAVDKFVGSISGKTSDNTKESSEDNMSKKRVNGYQKVSPEMRKWVTGE
ncbi:MAG: hypothetical protein Q9M19_05655 [Mariprofundaceae bacterium]|nr:hypothetical protein [Mariprofundaceae bacterium]